MEGKKRNKKQPKEEKYENRELLKFEIVAFVEIYKSVCFLPKKL